MEGSASCWQAYGVLLAAQYAEPVRMEFHQLIVDAYAVQHPGGHEPRQVRSVAIHLMTLALFLDQDVDPALGTDLHKRMVSRPVFEPLTRPASLGDLTFAHVPTSGPVAPVRSSSYEWAESAWSAWRTHHDTVHRWLGESGLR